MRRLWHGYGAARRHGGWLVLALAALFLGVLATIEVLRGIGVVGHVPAGRVAGTYRVDYLVGSEELLLERDGTYKQTLQVADGARYQSMGRWAVVHQGSGTQVEMQQFTTWVDAWEGRMLAKPLVGTVNANLQAEMGFWPVLHFHEGLRYRKVR